MQEIFGREKSWKEEESERWLFIHSLLLSHTVFHTSNGFHSEKETFWMGIEDCNCYIWNDPAVLGMKTS